MPTTYSRILITRTPRVDDLMRRGRARLGVRSDYPASALLVDLAEDRGFSDYLALVEELEGLFARHVDVVIDRSLSPHFRPYIEREARPL